MTEVGGFVDRVGPLLPDGPVVVALSGGADSAALGLAVARAGIPARAITVDHGLPASQDLVGAAVRIAGELGLEHTVVRVPAAASEDELRRLRLAALEAALEPGEVVLTGHTRDDQAETVLGNLLRGAGATGLAGIPGERGRWRRPLLDIARETTRRVATLAGLPFVDDPDNLRTDIRRNRLRSETIPSLEGSYNPALRAALARTAHVVAADDELLERRAASVPIRIDEEAVLIPAAALATLPSPIATRVVRRALRSIYDPYPGVSGDVVAVLAAVGGSRQGLSGDVVASREGPFVAVVRPGAPQLHDPIELAVPGRVRFGDWSIAAGSPAGAAIGRRGAVIGGEGPLVVRHAQSGDRIAIEGGSKKVADALAEAGVPRRLRARWPVIERSGRIAWLVSIRAAAAAEGEVGVSATRSAE